MVLSTLALLVLGAAAAATGITGTIVNAQATKEANEANINYQKEANALEMAYNSAEAEKQRQWETEMSNTQVQRAMADYQAAGLNPLLAIPGGASYGSGAAANSSISAPKVAPVSAAGDALNSISSAAMSMANLMLVSKLVDSKISAKELSNLRSGTSADKIFKSYKYQKQPF